MPSSKEKAFKPSANLKSKPIGGKKITGKSISQLAEESEGEEEDEDMGFGLFDDGLEISDAISKRMEALQRAPAKALKAAAGSQPIAAKQISPMAAKKAAYSEDESEGDDSFHLFDGLSDNDSPEGKNEDHFID